MKFKLLFAFLLGGAMMASAQGLKDAVEYFRADQPEEAEIIINRVINDKGTDKALADYYLGQIAFQKGDIAKAKSLFEQGIKANSNNPYNYVGLGQVALKNGNKAEAEANFKQARAIGKKDGTLLTDIARAYYNVNPVTYAKEIDKAIADVKKVDKQSTPLYIFLADMHADKGEVGDAAGFYEMAMQSKNGAEYPEAFVKYARTYFRVNPEYAIKGLQNLLQLTPNSALAQRELAEKYYDNNQLTRAAEQYGKYIQNPNHFQRDEQRYVGLLYFGKKYDESNRWADKVLASDPNNIYMKRMKFLNYAALEQNSAALAAADEFFGMNGEHTANDYTTYGELLHKVGQDSLSIIAYEKAVAIAPDKPNLYADLSGAYATAGQYGKAAEAQQKFIDAGDYTTNDMVILARRYQNAAATSEIGTPERAEYGRRAVDAINYVYEKVPDNYTVKLTRVRILLIANDNQVNEEIVNAMKDLLTDLDADPENVGKRRNDYIFIYNQLGKYYMDNGDKDQAKYYYTKFVEIDPTNEPLVKYVETVFK